MISGHIIMLVRYMHLPLRVGVSCSYMSLGFSFQSHKDPNEVFIMLVESFIHIPSIFTTPYDSQLKQRSMEEDMAPLCHFEPEGFELLDADQEPTQLVDKVGWRKLFINFSGHNVEVTRTFSLSLKERVAQIGDLQLVLSENFIAQATGLLQSGEKWFK